MGCWKVQREDGSERMLIPNDFTSLTLMIENGARVWGNQCIRVRENQYFGVCGNQHFGASGGMKDDLFVDGYPLGLDLLYSWWPMV